MSIRQQRMKMREKYAQGAQKRIIPDYPILDWHKCRIKENPKIGIGVTTRNRTSEAFVKAYAAISWFAPDNSKIVVVDDASDTPVLIADFRFRRNVGIAAAKNKCLELLDECDYIFLFDDDCWPTVHGWERPYIQSGLHHASFTFDRNAIMRNGNDKIGELPGLTLYKNPCGCMLFFSREVIQRVGGYNLAFGKYGNEHVDISVRIYNAGLTPHPFVDVKDSFSLFHSMDYHGTIQSTEKIKKQHLTYHLIGQESRFLPYKTASKEKFTVIGCFFNSVPDPQRNEYWQPDFSKLEDWINSIIDCGGEAVLLHDCFDSVPDLPGLTAKRITVDPRFTPTTYRWIAIREYLREHNVQNTVFLTDSTDVVVLKTPSVVPGLLFVGDEKDQKLNNQWLQRDVLPYTIIPDIHEFVNKNATRPLLNMGIIGGTVDVVKWFLDVHYEINSAYSPGLTKTTDMALGNYVLYKYFSSKVVTGEAINTVFKEYRANNFSWFMHK